MVTRVENQQGIREIYTTIVGRVPDGTLMRAVTMGKIPDSGPGSYSIPRALKAIQQDVRRLKQETTGQVPVMETKKDRRSWNLNNSISPKKK